MLRTVLLCCLAGVLTAPVRAQYALRAERPGPGHAVVEGGGYVLQGTVGQPATRIVGDDPYLGAGFWYAVRNANVALPVELVSFDAVQRSDAVVLTWTTATETNNTGFAVERNVEGRWQELDFVPGAGTTTAPQSYRYADADLPFTAETLVYRLRQVDADGTTSYSKELQVERGAPEQMVLHPSVPNPLRTQATLRYELPRTASVRLTVYDVTGRRVATLVNQEQSNGRKTVRFRAGALASGSYFVRLEGLGQQLTQRLTVVR